MGVHCPFVHKETNKMSDAFGQVFVKGIGVIFKAKQQKWSAQRRSKFLKKVLYNGSHDDPAQAAHASDTLARKLMTNGEQGHKLNFPEICDEVYPEPRNKRKRPDHDF